MKSSRYLIAAFVAAAFLALVPGAHAQATRTWVSGVGDDANPGSRTAPCKTFAGAIAKTAAGGEIDGLDPGGFGALTITKAITLDGCATHAGVLVAGTNGITINDATPGDTIILRRLDINGISVGGTPEGLTGVSIVAGTNVLIEDCQIYGFSQYAVNVAATSSCNVIIKDCTFTNNTLAGVDVPNTDSGTVGVSVRKTEISGSQTGIYAAFGTVEASECEITNCSTYGLDAESGAAITAETCIINLNATAVLADTGSRVRLSNNDFFDNFTAGFTGSGAISSAGNNKKGNNGAFPGAPNESITIQ